MARTRRILVPPRAYSPERMKRTVTAIETRSTSWARYDQQPPSVDNEKRRDHPAAPRAKSEKCQQESWCHRRVTRYVSFLHRPAVRLPNFSPPGHSVLSLEAPSGPMIVGPNQQPVSIKIALFPNPKSTNRQDSGKAHCKEQETTTCLRNLRNVGPGIHHDPSVRGNIYVTARFGDTD